MNKTTLRRFEELAIATTPEVRWSRTTHFAGVYLKNKMISFAYNEEKGHTMIKKFRYHHNCKNIHAELKAIIRLGRRDDFHKLVLVSARVDMNNSLNLARPCSGCSHLISSLGFKKIYFTNSSGGWDAIDSDEIEEASRDHKIYNIGENTLDSRRNIRTLQLA